MKVNEFLDNTESVRLAGSGNSPQGGNSHTTYVFADTAERCTGTPSPENEAAHLGQENITPGDDNPRAQLNTHYGTPGNTFGKSNNYGGTLESSVIGTGCSAKWSQMKENGDDDEDREKSYAYGQILFKNIPADDLKVFIKSEKFSNFQRDYHKCYVRGYGPYPNYGHLYTITSGDHQNQNSNQNQERTYDEPCIGDDLPRSRSWLCCPGSQTTGDQQPPLLSPTVAACVTGQTVTSPTEQEPVTKPPMMNTCGNGCERVKQQLDEQAQRYEEQLTELHSVIAELTRKLHQQRAMAITEEDEASEVCTSAHEDSITCPLEVSELEPLENDLSDTETKLPLAESPLELPDPKLNTSQHDQNDITSRDEIDTLRTELQIVRAQLAEAQLKLAQNTTTPEPNLYQKTIDTIPESPLENEDEPLETEESDVAVFLSDEKLNIKSSTIVPIHKSSSTLEKNRNSSSSVAPVAKMAERVRLRRATEDDKIVSTLELVNTGLSTAVAEHLVGDILRQCDQPEKQALEVELRRINAKLEHVKAQNTVLALTLTETKEHCDRLALLCGKYESNAIALRLALGISDRAIEAYDVLLALLETELAIERNHEDSAHNRTAAESVAKQLLGHLDLHQSSDVLLSPWQHSIYPNPNTYSEPWTPEHETRLREHVSRFKQERSSIQGTYVTLESTHIENLPRISSTQESRKMDLEMAVLMQELMSLREDKAELLTKLFILEKEKGSAEVKLKYVEGQQRAQSAALKNLQGQLTDTEALLVHATQNKERGYSDAEHAQGVELELMQALARESRLKIRLHELVSTLEQVTKNAEARLLEGRELVHDLNQTNSVLVETIDRNYRKYQSRLKKMEHQMLHQVDRHSLQVENLKQRIASLENPSHQINSSGNSETSI